MSDRVDGAIRWIPNRRAAFIIARDRSAVHRCSSARHVTAGTSTVPMHAQPSRADVPSERQADVTKTAVLDV